MYGVAQQVPRRTIGDSPKTPPLCNSLRPKPGVWAPRLRTPAFTRRRQLACSDGIAAGHHGVHRQCIRCRQARRTSVSRPTRAAATVERDVPFADRDGPPRAPGKARACGWTRPVESVLRGRCLQLGARGLDIVAVRRRPGARGSKARAAVRRRLTGRRGARDARVRHDEGEVMRAIAIGVLVLAATVVLPASVTAQLRWQTSVPVSNQVASQPVTGGATGPAGQTAPVPGTCRLGAYNANRSESWIAVKPGTEDLVGTSKIFFEKYSTFYDFHLGAHTFVAARMPAARWSRATSVSPPADRTCRRAGRTTPTRTWTSTQGRAYQTTLPFNAFWANLHPNGAIGVSYSDDLGRHWVTGNGGLYLDMLPNSSTFAFGDVVDKQWIAVDHFAGSRFQDYVYAFWSTFNGNSVKIRFARSTDRGATITSTERCPRRETWGPARPTSTRRSGEAACSTSPSRRSRARLARARRRSS